MEWIVYIFNIQHVSTIIVFTQFSVNNGSLFGLEIDIEFDVNGVTRTDLDTLTCGRVVPSDRATNVVLSVSG